MYLSSVGWCLLLGYAGNKILSICEQSKTLLISSRALCLVIFSFLIVSTINQIRVWKSGVTLWKHQLNVEPKVATALIYQKLAHAYTEADSFDIDDQQKVGRIEGLYKKALEVKPDYANAYWRLGELYFQMKEYDKAKKHLSEAISLKHDHFEANFSKGQLYYETGNNENGLRAFIRVIQINPENERLYQKITQFYLSNSKYSQDHAVFQKGYARAAVVRGE